MTSSRLWLFRGAVLTAFLLSLPGSAADDPSAEKPAATAEKPESAKNESAIRSLDPGLLGTVIEKLSVESRKDFAELLKEDWKDPPEWVRMLIPLLSDGSMAPGAGWFTPSQVQYDWKWLAAKYDSNGDGTISPGELPETVAGVHLVERLDRDLDGKLQSADFDYASRQQPNMPQMFSQLLTTAVDTDTNGRITSEELSAFLKLADKEQTGFITPEDLLANFSEVLNERGARGGDRPDPGQMVSMFFRGELGLWEEGPSIGDTAPDFTLPTHDGKQKVTLSQSRGKPVILIFGSFT